MSQKYIRRFVETSAFQYATVIIIVINAIVLGLETSPVLMDIMGPLLKTIDRLILFTFVIEISLRFYAYGFSFFKQPWSLFDFVVVAASFAPNGGTFSSLRTLRTLRALRLISTIPAMRKVIESLIKAIPGILSVFFIMLLFFYVSALIGTNLYGNSFPDWFGSIGKTMYSLFQIMTLESWSMGIVRPVMEVYPHAWLFFVIYITVASFTLLNLFIGVVVTAMNITEHMNITEEESPTRIKEDLNERIDRLEEHLLAEIRKKNNE